MGLLSYMDAAVGKCAEAEQLIQIPGFKLPFKLEPTEPFFLPADERVSWGRFPTVRVR